MATVKRHWRLCALALALMMAASGWIVVLNLSADRAVGEETAANPKPAEDEKPEGLDTQTHSQVQVLRRRLRLTNESLAAMGCSPEAAGSVRLPPWVLAAAAPPAPPEPLGIQCLSPGVTSVVMALTAAGGLLLLWVALVPLAKQMFRGKRAAIAWLVIVATSSNLVAAADWREAVLGVVMVLLSVCGLWAAFVYVLRWNPLAVFAGSVTIFLAGSASDLLWFPAHRSGAIALYAAAAIIVLWAIIGTVVAWRRGSEVAETLASEHISFAAAASAAESDGAYEGSAGGESRETETQSPGD